MRNLKNIFRFGIFTLFIWVAFFSSRSADAATLGISPSSGTFPVGKTFSVSVYASSNDSYNAAAGKISFPDDKLDVVSISKSGSIISLWAQEPSHDSGSVNFEGIIMNPGHTGSGKILSITFKVKSAGTANLSFQSASVLANDGNGTEILSGSGSAIFVLQAVDSAPPANAQPPVKSDPKPTITEVPVPVVTSTNCPDPEKWCKDNNPTLVWTLPREVNGVSIAITQSPNSNPGTNSDGLFNIHTYTNVANGAWYFHIRFRTAGGWGEAAHFKIQIDTQKPTSLSISQVPGATDSTVLGFKLSADDALSGLDYFEITTDGGQSEIWRDNGGHTYQTKELAPGSHQLLVKVVDKAGNFETSSATFSVTAAKEPTIVEYPKEVTVGDNLVVKGISDPESSVVIYVQKGSNEPAKYILQSDKDGYFQFASLEKIPEGIYSLWATRADATGNDSKYAKIFIPVRQSDLLRISLLVTSFLSLILSIAGILVLIVLTYLFGAKKINELIGQLEEKRQFTPDKIKKLCESCEDRERSLLKKIKILEKAAKTRVLTKEEDAVKKLMQETLRNLKANLKIEKGGSEE